MTTTKIALLHHQQASAAALAFEARWTYAALKRTDPELATNLHDQVQMFHAACVTGTAAEIIEHGEATVRGFMAAIAAMDGAQVPDDAYLVGRAASLTIAIGDQRAAALRALDIDPPAVWLTPDECARLLERSDDALRVLAVKRQFPGAEMVDRPVDEASLKATLDKIDNTVTNVNPC